MAISDVVTGLFGAVSVLAGLLARDATPRTDIRGQRIDVSLLESTLAVLVNQAQNAFVTGRSTGPAGQRPPQPSCRTRPSARPMASSRWPSAASGSGPGCATRSGCQGSPRTRGSRPTATASSIATTSARSSRRGSRAGPTAEWLEALDAADVPFGPINDVTAAFASPQAIARGMTVEVEHPVLGAVRQVGLPFRLSATPALDPDGAARCSASTPAEILAELGYGANDVATLRDLEVV